MSTLTTLTVFTRFQKPLIEVDPMIGPHVHMGPIKIDTQKSPSSRRVIFWWFFVSEASSYINYAREAAIKGRQIRNFFWKQTFWENLLMNVYTVQLYSRKRRSIVTFSLLLIMCEFCNKKYIKRHKYRKNRMEWQMTKHTNANPVFALGNHAWSGEGKYVDHRPERPFCIVFFSHLGRYW